MPKIAIDVVILPSQKIISKAIAINNQFGKDPIKLNTKNCLPHLSLAMGIIDEKNLTKTKKIINKIAQNFDKLNLHINKINGSGVCFEITKNKNLQKLHEEIMQKLSPYLSYDAKVENFFYSPTKIMPKTLNWVNKYKDQSSFKNFHPHVTLGISKLEDKKLNITFTASNLAICHLGNYCTCKKILATINLK